MTKPPIAADLVIRDLADGEVYWQDRAVALEAELDGYRLVALVAVAQVADMTAKLGYERARNRRLLAELRRRPARSQRGASRQ